MADKTVQRITGVLDLEEVTEIRPDLQLKVAVARDCYIIYSRVYQLEPGQKLLDLELRFEVDRPKPIGVRLLVGPDVPDEQLRSVDHHQVWLPAKSFKRGVVDNLRVKIPERQYFCWWRWCRTFTLRGRVVCRRWVWDRIEQTFVVCDAPVRGAEVTAYDVDRFWWWYRRDPVGSDFTDANGIFEIKFRWCCWWWRPWFFERWRLDPEVVGRIQDVLSRAPLLGPIPKPDPVPDLGIFARLLSSTEVASPGQELSEAAAGGGQDFVRLGEELVRRLPEAPELARLHIWPWWPILDCHPDIVFKVTQDCGEGEQTIYVESNAQTRWNIPTELNGVILVANDKACCAPFCCSDPPDEDCLEIHGVGCDNYPITVIDQDPASDLAGYAHPGTHDRPFGGTIRILGVFGDASETDYYKPQRRRISPAPTGWTDLPEGEVVGFTRWHDNENPPPLWIKEEVKLIDVDGQKVLRTIDRFREEEPDANENVFPIRGDWLFQWKTFDGPWTNGAPMPGLLDGLYELRFVGYRLKNKKLVDQKIMSLCPAPGEEVDPSKHSTLLLRLDNRVVSTVTGSVHLNTTEPDCDFPDECAVVKNENPKVPLSLQKDKCVDPCGFVRLKDGDTLTIHFEASDSDGHLEEYRLTAHWEESKVFNVLSAGTLEPDPDQLVGPKYADTFAGNQAAHRAGLPAADPEHDRPFWYGGSFKVTVPVNDKYFRTCCAFHLRLEVWKRTTSGCTSSRYFQKNWCEFSFTVIREDLIGDPGHPSCSQLCGPEEGQKGERIE